MINLPEKAEIAEPHAVKYEKNDNQTHPNLKQTKNKPNEKFKKN